MAEGTLAYRINGEYFEVGDIVEVDGNYVICGEKIIHTGRIAEIYAGDGINEDEILLDESSEYESKKIRIPVRRIVSIVKRKQPIEQKITVNTSIGKIVAYTCGDIMYPGIAIDFIPNGEKFQAPVVLAEVKEACEDTRLTRPEFHLRPYVSDVRGSVDEDGRHVVGKVSWDAPFSDICLMDDEFANEEE